ncbi:MAG: argininosuccinate synthase domain-containing protein [bacterium]
MKFNINPRSTFEQNKKYDGVSLYSGGTDSTLSSILGTKDCGGEILLLMANLSIEGAGLETAIERAKIMGKDLLIVDGHAEFAQNYLNEAIAMNASYQGYPNGTPMGRAFAVMSAVQALNNGKDSPKYMIHGCVKRQNTRIRIEELSGIHNIVGYGPFIARPPYTREEKVAMLKKCNIEVVSQDSFATDENIWNRAVEGVDLNDLGCEIDEERIFIWTKSINQTPDKPVRVMLTFSEGNLVSLNGQDKPLHDIIIELLYLGGEHGVGRIMVIEDTIPIFSEKIRDYYEAPSASIITTAHKFIEACIFTKQERDEKDALDKLWGEQVYEGRWFYPSIRNIAKRGWELQKKVSGIVTLELFKGNIIIRSADIPNSRLLTKQANKGTY